MKKFFLSLFWAAFFITPGADAAPVAPHPDFSLHTPDGWEIIASDIRTNTPPAVSQVLDCVDDDLSALKMVGWKREGDSVQGAFCISYRQRGGAKGLSALKNSQGSEREALAARLLDGFAAGIAGGYAKRNMSVTEMSADLLDAGPDAVLVLDGKVKGKGRQYIRSATVYLHGDAIVNIGFIYDTAAPEAVVNQLDVMPVSVQWKK